MVDEAPKAGSTVYSDIPSKIVVALKATWSERGRLALLLNNLTIDRFLCPHVQIVTKICPASSCLQFILHKGQKQAFIKFVKPIKVKQVYHRLAHYWSVQH